MSLLLSKLMLILWLCLFRSFFSLNISQFVANRCFYFLIDGATVAIRSCTLKSLIQIGKANGFTDVSQICQAMHFTKKKMQSINVVSLLPESQERVVSLN